MEPDVAVENGEVRHLRFVDVRIAVLDLGLDPELSGRGVLLHPELLVRIPRLATEAYLDAELVDAVLERVDLLVALVSDKHHAGLRLSAQVSEQRLGRDGVLGECGTGFGPIDTVW